MTVKEIRTLRIDYKYFLKRRNLTTEGLIKANNITHYEQFVEVLKKLKVIPLSKEDFNEAMKRISIAAQPATKETKNEPNKKKTTVKPTKSRSTTRKGRTRSTTRKKSTVQSKDGDLSKER